IREDRRDGVSGGVAGIAHRRSAIRRILIGVADSRGNRDRFAAHASPRGQRRGKILDGFWHCL
ncbi:MAG TPA: hypothetical protein VGM32_03590, partial [Rhodopila sp.]